jgi:hypothetical protein
MLEFPCKRWGRVRFPIPQIPVGFTCILSYTTTLIFALQGIQFRADAELGVLRSLASDEKSQKIPLLKRDIIMNVEEFPRRCDRRNLTRGFLSSRPTIFVLVSVVVCLMVCVSIFHHGRVNELAVSIRRCLFNH